MTKKTAQLEKKLQAKAIKREEILKQLEKIDLETKKIKSELKKEDKKSDTRKKILIGAAVLKAVELNLVLTEDKLQSILDVCIERKSDRKFLELDSSELQHDRATILGDSLISKAEYIKTETIATDEGSKPNLKVVSNDESLEQTFGVSGS